MSHNLHNLHNTLQGFSPAAGKSAHYYSLPELAKTFPAVARLPVSIRIVLESVLRNCDGKKVSEHHIKQLANWQPNAARTDEIPFVLARIVLQDFTGVPLLADLAAMRGVAHKMGKNPKIIEPLVPVDLVVDHSVQVDSYGSKDSLDINMKLEFQRNQERYQFMKWGMQAFDTFKVVPPGVGIVHQVNLEYLARGVHAKNGVYYPDTLVGTDSHTTMINAIGVVGWGVGGIEAEAGMLGQPVYFLTPDVVGVRQNLHLVVDQSAVPSGVDSNVQSAWGPTIGGKEFVWRSGVGVTADGRVIFVYAPALSVRTLAELLRQAGCVEAMQLDINPAWMSYQYYNPAPDPANPTPTKLLPTQERPADRYFTPTSRDFVAVYAR